jgi:DNA topoisomerase I
MRLVLVESPTKARKLSGYLGKDFTVRASVGHIRDLPKSKLGIDVEHNFTPEYMVPKEKAKVVKELQALAANADSIILATDPDREGEAIAWHLRTLLEGKSKKDAGFVRATFHEITKEAVLHAMEQPSILNMALVDAQQARRVLDRLVGYSLSPVLWKKVRYGLSAGRVQSVALRLIVEREQEIRKFVPEEYWEMAVEISPVGDKKAMFVAKVVTVNQKKFSPHSAADVEPVKAALPGAQYQVTNIDRKERNKASVPAFTTSTLQQQAATRLGMSSKQTMRLAQQLYEEGVITYHRTDSVNLSSQALEMARGWIQAELGTPYLPAQPRYFSTKSKNAQEAHEAIRPTSVNGAALHGQTVDPSVALRAKHTELTASHWKLYDLIWRRFIASQMNAAVYDATTIDITARSASPQLEVGVRASGSILKFPGWLLLFPHQEDVILPSLEVGADLDFHKVIADQKFTEPPPRFNDASLVKTLESEGIGRPSTYASIISVLEDRSYVERKAKAFVPTPIGEAVCLFLLKYFPQVMDYAFTAKMEDTLDAVSRGEAGWQATIGDFYHPFAKTVEEVTGTAERAEIPVERTGRVCPKCGDTEHPEQPEFDEQHGEIVIRSGKFGKFYSCSRFPECDYKDNIVNTVDGVMCPLCQEGQVVVKPTRWRRDFYSCTRYPDCSWASWKKPKPGEKLTAAEWAQMQKEREERRKLREEKMAAEGKTVGAKGTKVTASKKRTTRAKKPRPPAKKKATSSRA